MVLSPVGSVPGGGSTRYEVRCCLEGFSVHGPPPNRESVLNTFLFRSNDQACRPVLKILYWFKRYLAMPSDDSEDARLRNVQQQFIKKFYEPHKDTLPAQDAIERARKAIVTALPDEGIGIEGTVANLERLTDGLNNGSLSSSYYGFVTGGSTPVAQVADTVCSVFDQNVAVHLPNETIATAVEYETLQLLCRLLDLAPADFKHRTFTTGATASNVLGVACGREYVIAKAAERHSKSVSVGRDGLITAMRESGIDKIQILTTVPHSSLGKAASIVGLGRNSVRLVGKDDVPHKFDFAKLKHYLQQPKTASIVVISCGEVNTGYFATSYAEMKQIRALCDEAGAFIHCDGGQAADFFLSSNLFLSIVLWPDPGSWLTAGSIRANGTVLAGFRPRF